MSTPGFGSQPESRAARITVVGHASTRWRGARSRTEAAQRNEALAKLRAESVAARIEKVLKQEVPNLDITSGTSLAEGQGPTGVEVGSYGVGSREPVLNPPRIAGYDPNENDRLNRSVQVRIELTTTKYGSAPTSRQSLRISGMSKFWYGQVLDLSGVALGVASYSLLLRLRNPYSGKQATYFGLLIGGGLSSKASKPKGATEYHVDPTIDKKPRNPFKPVGGEFSFYTDEVMGFDDFSGELVKIEKASAKLGIGAKATYLSFVGLGSGAQMISFDTGFSLGNPLKPSLNGSVVSGTVKLNEPNPGDWYEVDGGTNSVPFTVNDQVGDGVIISFPTGKASVSDLGADERERLETFVKRWAARI